jgi:hypothetical protein
MVRAPWMLVPCAAVFFADPQPTDGAFQETIRPLLARHCETCRHRRDLNQFAPLFN